MHEYRVNESRRIKMHAADMKVLLCLQNKNLFFVMYIIHTNHIIIARRLGSMYDLQEMYQIQRQ